MKPAAIVVVFLVGGVIIFGTLWFANNTIAPLFLNSRIERLHESNLPRIIVEGSTICCRMKADDFRFPLPPGSRATNPVVTGGFDSAHGTIEARFDGSNRMTATQYRSFLQGKLQRGANITAWTSPEGLLITFDYFGDK